MVRLASRVSDLPFDVTDIGPGGGWRKVAFDSLRTEFGDSLGPGLLALMAREAVRNPHTRWAASTTYGEMYLPREPLMRLMLATNVSFEAQEAAFEALSHIEFSGAESYFAPLQGEWMPAVSPERSSFVCRAASRLSTGAPLDSNLARATWSVFRRLRFEAEGGSRPAARLLQDSLVSDARDRLREPFPGRPPS